MKRKKPEYDPQRKAKAQTIAGIRGAISLYLIYLGYQLISGANNPESSMSPAVAILAGGLFIAIALAFGAYVYRGYRRDMEDAILEAPREDGEEGERP